jgi:hypothetical protein
VGGDCAPSSLCLVLAAGSPPPFCGGAFTPVSGSPGGGGFAVGASPFVFGKEVVERVVLEEATKGRKAPAVGIDIMSFKPPAAVNGTVALSFHGVLSRIMSSVGFRSYSLSYCGE